jgi:hypothetical protein
MLSALKVLPGGLCLVLGCCVNPERIHDDFTARWIGQPIDEFTVKYGLSSGSQKLRDGRTVVEWSEGYGVANTGSPLVGRRLPSVGPKRREVHFSSNASFA